MSHQKILAAALGGISAWVTVKMADMGDLGELSGGQITGPMIASAFVAALLLLGGALFQFRRKGLAIYFTILGWLLALPWASWLLFPGMWCRFGTCASTYPVVVSNRMAILMILLPPLAIALRRK